MADGIYRVFMAGNRGSGSPQLVQADGLIFRRSADDKPLIALLEPWQELQRLEREGDYTSRLALSEEALSLPFGAVWDHYCETRGVPVSVEWIEEIKNYEQNVQATRS